MPDDRDPWDDDPVDQLPSVIEPGPIDFTLWTSALGDDPTAYDLSFTWEADHTATWFEDISILNVLSPGSSAPIRGIVSWPDGNDVLLTYTWFDLGLQGYDRLPDAAPTRTGPDGAKDPRQWIRLGQELLDFILLDLGSRGDSPDGWFPDYYDPAGDTTVDIHEMFRIFLGDVRSQRTPPDFNDWLRDAVAAGTYVIARDDE